MIPEFTDPGLLETAFTHRSALNEPESGTKSLVSNERLEFLGDAVLELAVTRYLFRQQPKEPEGKLTAYRSALVRTSTLAQAARDLSLGSKLYMSKGEESTGGRDNESLLADAMEALIGAIYLDQGFSAAERFIADNILPKFKEIKQKKLYKDAKSLLQEVVQAEGYPTPEYEVVKEVGPDHNKQFTVKVRVNDEIEGLGQGSSKQRAQQKAARRALAEFDKT